MGKALVMVAIVTGASSGFGYEVCKQLVEKGYKVYGISRRKHAPTGVTAISCVARRKILPEMMGGGRNDRDKICNKR